MGTYPSFAFTPNDDAVIIWAAGQIYHVPLSTNTHGERTKSTESPAPIPFIAHVEKRIADTRSSETDLLTVETNDTQRVYAFTELRTNEEGTKVVFQAAAVNYVYDVHDEEVKAVPTLHHYLPYYSPSFVPHAEDLVIHARWHDSNFSTFELANITSGEAFELTGLPLGRYYSPILCECAGTQRKIAFVKAAGDYLSGNVVATAGAGLYVGELSLPSSSSVSKDSIEVKNVQFVSASTTQDDPAATKLRFLEKSAKILVQQSNYAFVVDLAFGPDEYGAYKEEIVASGEMSQELVAVPAKDTAAVAFVDFMHVYYAPGVSKDQAVWSKPGKATKKLARLSLDGGHDVVFSGNGKKLFWLLGVLSISFLIA
jgi:hypothetical protein